MELRGGEIFGLESETGWVVEKFPGEVEPFGEVASEGFDAEGFCGVVAREEEVDAEFFGGCVAPVGTFAGDEGIEAFFGDAGNF